MNPLPNILRYLLLASLVALNPPARAETVEQLYQAGLYVARGNQAMNMSLWDEAEQEYWKAVALDYNNIRARMGLGNVYFQKKLFERAIENYQLVLDQQPGNVEVQYQISLSYYENHQYEQARLTAEKAFQLDPNLAKAENLVRLSQDKAGEQDQENNKLRKIQEDALRQYRNIQERKEEAFIGKVVPGWRLIQMATPGSKWKGYSILGGTATLLLGGYMLRKKGASAYSKASVAPSFKKYQELADQGTSRYKLGGYFVDAALGTMALNFVDSFLLHGKIFGGHSRIKPSLPERERHQQY